MMEEYKFITINGINIAYRQEGQGRPVVLVHGFASFSYTWLSLVKLLPSGFKYIALDLKGFGRSDKPRDKAYSAYDQANILAEFINKLNLENAIIIGHSFGGITSLLAILSGRIKNPVRGLILIDSVAYFKHMPDFIANLRIPVANMLELELIPSRTLVRQVLEEVFYDKSKITEEMINEYAECLSLPGAKTSLVRSASQFVSEDMKHVHDKFGQIDIPALVISGVDDRLIPVQESYYLKRDLQRVELKVIPQCGHSPQEECPDETAKIVREFLKKSGSHPLAVKIAAFPANVKIKLKELIDKWTPSTLVFIVVLSFMLSLLKVLKLFGYRSKENGWRTITQSYLRTEHTKFILAAFRLNIWSDMPPGTDKDPALARAHITRRLALFLRNHLITHLQLEWGRFSTKKEIKYPVDIVCADFNAYGALNSIDPHFDNRWNTFSAIQEDRKKLLNASIVNTYNALKDFKDEHRPRHLRKRLIKSIRANRFISKEERAESIDYLERILNSTFIHFETLPSLDNHGIAGRFKYPNFIKRKHPGFGIFNICCRLTADSREADFWFQISHILIDGVPMQEILNTFKAEWTTCGDSIFPSVAYDKKEGREIALELCSTENSGRARYDGSQLIDFRPFLKTREELSARYARELTTPITVISMLGWGLAHHDVFAGRKFLFPVDLPAVGSHERTLGFVAIRPSSYFKGRAPRDGFLAYQMEFNNRLYKTQARISEIYKLFEAMALLPSPIYWLTKKFMKSGLSALIGSVVITSIKEADFFVAPFSDIILDGFIAFGNISMRTKDDAMVGLVSAKSTKENTVRYINAVEDVVTDFGKYV
ncbi:alpha/beta fold hydrolase [Candidatus Omnitrophota bacterium]